MLYYDEDDESGQQPTWKILISWALHPDLAHCPAPGTGSAVSGLWISGRMPERVSLCEKGNLLGKGADRMGISEMQIINSKTCISLEASSREQLTG